jgi:hypothetical protein
MKNISRHVSDTFLKYLTGELINCQRIQQHFDTLPTYSLCQKAIRSRRMFACFASDETFCPIVLPNLLITVKTLRKKGGTEILPIDHTRSLPAGKLQTAYPDLSSKVIHSRTCDPKEEADYLKRFTPGKIIHFDPNSFIPDPSCKIFNSSPSPRPNQQFMRKRKAVYEKEESHESENQSEDKIKMTIVGVELMSEFPPLIKSDLESVMEEVKESDEDNWRTVNCSKRRNFKAIF